MVLTSILKLAYDKDWFQGVASKNVSNNSGFSESFLKLINLLIKKRQQASVVLITYAKIM